MKRFLKRGEQGQAALEFVLVLPFFIAFVLLTIDFGLVMYEYVSVANAAREGARYGAVNCGGATCTAVQIETQVANKSGGIITVAEATGGAVPVSWVTRGGATAGLKGSSVVVKINHQYNFLFAPSPIFPVAINFPVYSCADMRLEQDDSPKAASPGGC